MVFAAVEFILPRWFRFCWHRLATVRKIRHPVWFLMKLKRRLRVLELDTWGFFGCASVWPRWLGRKRNSIDGDINKCRPEFFFGEWMRLESNTQHMYLFAGVLFVYILCFLRFCLASCLYIFWMFQILYQINWYTNTWWCSWFITHTSVFACIYIV